MSADLSAAAATLLRDACGDRVRIGVPLAPLTSFRLGGPAALYLEPEDDADLRAASRGDRGSRHPRRCPRQGLQRARRRRGVPPGWSCAWAAATGGPRGRATGLRPVGRCRCPRSPGVALAARPRRARVRGRDPGEPGGGGPDERRGARRRDGRRGRTGRGVPAARGRRRGASPPATRGSATGARACRPTPSWWARRCSSAAGDPAAIRARDGRGPRAGAARPSRSPSRTAGACSRTPTAITPRGLIEEAGCKGRGDRRRQRLAQARELHRRRTRGDVGRRPPAHRGRPRARRPSATGSSLVPEVRLVGVGRWLRPRTGGAGAVLLGARRSAWRSPRRRWRSRYSGVFGAEHLFVVGERAPLRIGGPATRRGRAGASTCSTSTPRSPEAALLEDPWIAEAVVEASLPNTIDGHGSSERRPIAVGEGAGGRRATAPCCPARTSAGSRAVAGGGTLRSGTPTPPRPRCLLARARRSP